MKFLNVMTVVAGVALCAPTAHSQNYIYNLGSFDVGRSISAAINFQTGAEFYVGLVNVASDMSMEDGTELLFTVDIDTGSQDSEIAIFEQRGVALVAMNDDGESGDWGDPSWGSRLAFGDTPAGNADGYDGNTVQGTFGGNPSDLMAGSYAFVVGTYATMWDELDGRNSVAGYTSGGYTVSLSAQ